MRLHLASIEKSGTNYFRVCMFNYLCHLQGDTSLKTYDDMAEAFPNQVRKGAIGTAPARSDLLPAPFTDFVYGHSPRAPWDLDADFKAIFLVRNPLDNVISWWHHAYKMRNATETLEEIAPVRLRQFAKKYAVIQVFSKAHGTAIIHYEDLMLEPVATFSRAFESVGLPVDRGLVALAADHASIKNARKFEDANGYMHTSRPEKRNPDNPNRFVRDGSIGQWQHNFDDGLAMVRAAGLQTEDFRFYP